MEEIELGTTGLVDARDCPEGWSIGRGSDFFLEVTLKKGGVTQLQVDPNLLDVPEQILFNQGCFLKVI